MIPPFIPWLLAALLLLACLALLVALLRYRDRSVRLEAESLSWRERAEDRTQMLRTAEEVLRNSFAGISAEVLRNSENNSSIWRKRVSRTSTSRLGMIWNPESRPLSPCSSR